jgi:uncharacterized protein (DUF1499 family)
MKSSDSSFWLSLVLIFLSTGHSCPSNPRLPALSTRKTAAAVISLYGLSAALSWTPIAYQPVLAFDNAVKVYDFPKTRGPAPTNLGLREDGNLRSCSRPSPNCFSTTSDITADDAEDLIDEHAIPLWKYRGTAEEAFGILSEVLDSYEPGQGGVDGGGFKVITQDPTKRYYYAQFESLKRGFIDDVEFTVNSDSSVQVVSSSRIGYLDLGVNAKRLNYIASQLRKREFEAPEITQKTHPFYFESNVQQRS